MPVKSIINNKLIAMQISTNCKYSRIAFIFVSCGGWPSLAVLLLAIVCVVEIDSVFQEQLPDVSCKFVDLYCLAVWKNKSCLFWLSRVDCVSVAFKNCQCVVVFQKFQRSVELVFDDCSVGPDVVCLHCCCLFGMVCCRIRLLPWLVAVLGRVVVTLLAALRACGLPRGLDFQRSFAAGLRSSARISCEALARRLRVLSLRFCTRCRDPRRATRAPPRLRCRATCCRLLSSSRQVSLCTRRFLPEPERRAASGAVLRCCARLVPLLPRLRGPLRSLRGLLRLRSCLLFSCVLPLLCLLSFPESPPVGGSLCRDHRKIIPKRDAAHKCPDPATASREHRRRQIHPPTRENRLGRRTGLRDTINQWCRTGLYSFLTFHLGKITPTDGTLDTVYIFVINSRI